MMVISNKIIRVCTATAIALLLIILSQNLTFGQQLYKRVAKTFYPGSKNISETRTIPEGISSDAVKRFAADYPAAKIPDLRLLKDNSQNIYQIFLPNFASYFYSPQNEWIQTEIGPKNYLYWNSKDINGTEYNKLKTKLNSKLKTINVTILENDGNSEVGEEDDFGSDYEPSIFLIKTKAGEWFEIYDCQNKAGKTGTGFVKADYSQASFLPN